MKKNPFAAKYAAIAEEAKEKKNPFAKKESKKEEKAEKFARGGGVESKGKTRGAIR